MGRWARLIVFAGVGTALCAGSTGCLRVAPKMPQSLSSAAPINYSATQFNQDVKAYQDAVDAGSMDLAKTRRNQVVFRTMAQIDNAYGKFELQMSMRRAGVQTAGDAANLGLTAAATIVGASAVKDILTATSTALQGTRLSYDKNYFEQKTTESLISQMRASRKTLQAQMLLSAANRDVASYPLESAWGDLVNYYYAGTLPSALVDIASKTGSAAVAADDNLQMVVGELAATTPEQARSSESNQAVYTRLSKQLASGDTAAVTQATETLQKILTAAQISYASGASPAELLAAYKLAIIATRNDNAKLAALTAAVKTATAR